MGKEHKYMWMIFLQSVLYGFMDIISKQVYQVMPIYCFLFLRYVLASGIMLLLWGKVIVSELKAVKIKTYIVPGVCMSCAFIFSNLALQYTTATNVSFIRSLSALLAPVLLLLFKKQKYKKTDIILQVFMLIGLYFLCAKGGLHGFGLGEMLALIAALLVAGSLVFGKDSLCHISAVSLSFVQALLAVIVCGVMSVATQSIGYATDAGSLQIVLSLIYAAVGCTIGGYMLQNVALKHISSKIVGMIQCVYPIATAVIAYFVLGERLSPLGIVGAILIIISVFLESVFD